MKKTLTLTLSIVLPLLLIGGGVSLYFGFFAPNAQAKNTADTVMQAAAAQQKDTFNAYGTPADSDSFYDIASQRNYRFESLAADGATFYILYAFTDSSTPTKARIGVENGRVTSMKTGSKIGATPKEDQQEAVQANDNTTHCLTRSDLAYLDSTSLYAKTFRGATMIFGDDTSTTYAGDENGKKLLDRMSNFYEKTKSKDYSFLIRGYLAAKKETLEARKQVIQNRTTKLQQELVTRNVPEDRIDIGEPVAYPIDRPTNSQDERYVIIDIVNNCIK